MNAILEARTAASSLRQDMVERMPPNTINQSNAYALDALRSYYGLDNVSEIATFRDVFCGGVTSDACRAQSKQIAELRNQDALRNLGVFTLASMIGLTVTTEVAAACLASTACVAAFTMADTAVALQDCAGGDVTSCNFLNKAPLTREGQVDLTAFNREMPTRLSFSQMPRQRLVIVPHGMG
ncbi:hypothetical protein HED54_23015 [Ochrobactrum anthropi ATCC 49188]|nr:hypothetical protein [Brucella anthropi ATCC 49188]